MKSTTPLFFILAATSLFHSAWAIDKPTPAAVTTNPALAGDGVQIGIAKRDGVTFSGGEASVTRNGATEKLTKELLLPSGVTVRPDGTVILADKTQATLRATQLLTFDGKIVPLPLDTNTNPGDPRGNGDIMVNTNGVSPRGTATGTNQGNASGNSHSLMRDQPAANGSVFLGSDGVPFMGTLNADGTLLRADGTLLRADGSYRAVTFSPDGTPALGTVNNNGTISRADGSIISPDGSVRSANGTLISPAPQNNLSTANNGNSNPGVPQNSNGTTQTNNGVAAGRSTNSPYNGGTVNNGNTNSGTTFGTQQGTNQQGTNSNNSNSGRTNGGTRGTNGATGGAANGGGASGAGGASGGAAGGASR